MTTRKESFELVGNKMVEYLKADNKKESDTLFEEVVALINEKFEWKIIATQKVEPNNISKMIKKPSKNGVHESQDEINKTAYDESCLLEHAMNELNNNSPDIKMVLCHKTKEGSAEEPLFYSKKSMLENGGIGAFAARNYNKDECISVFVGAKSDEVDRCALDVCTDDDKQCLTSIPIKGNKTMNRISSGLFLGGHMFNDKRFKGSNKDCDENNCYLGNKEGQNCLMIYSGRVKIRTNDELTFLCSYRDESTKLRDTYIKK